ncbi:MAG: cytochrome b/b6 domain-containing protein [Desulfovibrio sp.]|uniref:cytochrome b/b6 domain-containing protein n=1 Tax=Desulfovibrio sp. TaxID=885 RepID=UPI00135E5AEA|nr:cytochrome b/b6 domain-containing protein [Desulfovibrio sp.]MTJ94250.1 cytochrome b/b6 domain-containing protein [Desulfovibrio sp.]
MGPIEMLKSQFALLWRFLGFFQPPLLRLLHISVVGLVVLQVLTQLAGMSMTHAISGLVLSMLGLGLIALGLGTRGPRHYYPYLWGDMDQLKRDVAAIRSGKLIIAPRPKGLACVVQGLGMGALAMSMISGLWLFRSWQMGEISHAAATMHGIFVFLLVAYAVGHGGMAMGHFFFWKKAAAKK